jgi:hypothetical protein
MITLYYLVLMMSKGLSNALTKALDAPPTTHSEYSDEGPAFLSELETLAAYTAAMIPAAVIAGSICVSSS